MRKGEFEVTRKTVYKKEVKMPDTGNMLLSMKNTSFREGKPFKKPIRITYFMEQNSNTQFQNYKNKNFKKTNIKGL